MKHRTKFFSAVILVVGSLAATTGGCELISSVDRTKIPGGSGGGEAGGGGSTPSSSSTTLPVTTSNTTSTTSNGGGGNSTTSNGGGGNSTTSNGGGGNSTTSNGGGGSTSNGGGGSTSNGGGGSTGTSGGGGSGGCSSAADCAKPGVDCKVATCNAQHVCGVGDAMNGTACTASGVCLSGDCVGCINDSDCPTPPNDSCNMTSHQCTTGGCTDNRIDGMETDLNCGGPVCPGCGVGKKCVIDTDCFGGVAGDGSCSGSPKACQATCNDGVQDNVETDTDCGGGTCPKCDVGFKCMVDADCKSTGSGIPGFCNPTTKKCIAPTCTNLFQNGKETDLNCGGGTCPACAVGKTCVADTDCVGGVLGDGSCAGSPKVCQATCHDGVQDGTETDVDCGGSCGMTCEKQQHCVSNNDCDPASVSCQPHTGGAVCTPPSCQNTTLDTGETAIDCGGPNCAPCAAGAACALPRDCDSKSCGVTTPGICDP